MKKDLKLLKLVEILKELKVTTCGDYVEIENEDWCLRAIIWNEGNIEYYITGIYNSGREATEIDMDALKELKAVAEELAKEMGEEK